MEWWCAASFVAGVVVGFAIWAREFFVKMEPLCRRNYLRGWLDGIEGRPRQF